MREIKKIMEEVLSREGMGEMKDLLAVREIWPTLMENAEIAKPIRLERGRLYIRVSSHAWAQELRYRVEDIKRAVEEGAGIKITGITIKVKH